MTTRRMTEHEARARKALQLACAILSHGGTDREAATLDEAGWATAAEVAGTAVPSPATRAATVALLILLEGDGQLHLQLVGPLGDTLPVALSAGPVAK